MPLFELLTARLVQPYLYRAQALQALRRFRHFRHSMKSKSKPKALERHEDAVKELEATDHRLTSHRWCCEDSKSPKASVLQLILAVPPFLASSGKCLELSFVANHGCTTWDGCGTAHQKTLMSQGLSQAWRSQVPVEVLSLLLCNDFTYHVWILQYLVGSAGNTREETTTKCLACLL